MFSNITSGVSEAAETGQIKADPSSPSVCEGHQEMDALLPCLDPDDR